MKEMETKTCAKCKRTINVKHFYKSARMKDGYSSHCKSCICGVVRILTEDELVDLKAYALTHYTDRKYFKVSSLVRGFLEEGNIPSNRTERASLGKTLIRFVTVLKKEGKIKKFNTHTWENIYK